VDYLDWSEGVHWKKWFVACRRILLFATYNCKSGEQDAESALVSALLSSFQCRE
jgi:hypothetical protein